MFRGLCEKKVTGFLLQMYQESVSETQSPVSQTVEGRAVRPFPVQWTENETNLITPELPEQNHIPGSGGSSKTILNLLDQCHMVEEKDFTDSQEGN